MRENLYFVVPVNILTSFVHALFSWAAQHTTVCLDTVCGEIIVNMNACKEEQHLTLKIIITIHQKLGFVGSHFVALHVNELLLDDF